jgi:hypothetical protein
MPDLSVPIEDTDPSAAAAPAPDMLSEVQQYYDLLHREYTRRVAEIEAFLGFVTQSESLGTRLARVEAFLKIKG